MKQHDNSPSGSYIALIEQVQADLHDIKEDIREIRSGSKSDQKELWNALNGLRESITGNSKEGLVVRVDRNTNFRKTLNRLLWAFALCVATHNEEKHKLVREAFEYFDNKYRIIDRIDDLIPLPFFLEPFDGAFLRKLIDFLIGQAVSVFNATIWAKHPVT